MSDRGSGRGSTRGGPRGRGASRGRGSAGRGSPSPSLVGSGSGNIRSMSSGPGLPAASVTTVGVRRKDFGQAGRQIQVYTNHYEVDIPRGTIYHYDGVYSNPITM